MNNTASQHISHSTWHHSTPYSAHSTLLPAAAIHDLVDIAHYRRVQAALKAARDAAHWAAGRYWTPSHDTVKPAPDAR